MIEGGVISLTDKTSKVALVYGQMNEPPGARARVCLTGLTVAEYFRDYEVKMCYCSSITFSDSHKRDQKCLLCLAVFLPP